MHEFVLGLLIATIAALLLTNMGSFGVYRTTRPSYTPYEGFYADTTTSKPQTTFLATTTKGPVVLAGRHMPNPYSTPLAPSVGQCVPTAEDPEKCSPWLKPSPVPTKCFATCLPAMPKPPMKKKYVSSSSSSEDESPAFYIH